MVDLVQAAQRLVGNVAGCGVWGWGKGVGLLLGRTGTYPGSRTWTASWSLGEDGEDRKRRLLEQVLCVVEAIYE